LFSGILSYSFFHQFSISLGPHTLPRHSKSLCTWKKKNFIHFSYFITNICLQLIFVWQLIFVKREIRTHKKNWFLWLSWYLTQPSLKKNTLRTETDKWICTKIKYFSIWTHLRALCGFSGMELQNKRVERYQCGFQSRRYTGKSF
jgi:hypothetical protein